MAAETLQAGEVVQASTAAAASAGRVRSFGAQPLITVHAVILAVLVTVSFLMFVLVEPTQRWMALFGAAVAALGADGVMQAGHRRALERGLDTAPYLFLPALYALAIPLFVEEHAEGYAVLLAALGGGAWFGVLMSAQLHSVRPYAPRFHLARFVSAATTYVVAFAFFSLVYAFALDLVPAIGAVALLAGLLSIELLRDGSVDARETLVLSAVVGGLLAEVRWALHYLPVDGHLAALALLLAFFFTTGMLHGHLTQHLDRRLAVQYALVALAGTALIVVARLADVA